MTGFVDRRTFCTAIGLALLPLTPFGAAASGADIRGVAWKLVSLHGVAKLGDANVTLNIGADGGARGNGGCNSYYSVVSIDGKSVRFSQTSATRALCPGTVMKVERAYFDTLRDTVRFQVQGGALLLYDAGDRQRAKFTRAG